MRSSFFLWEKISRATALDERVIHPRLPFGSFCCFLYYLTQYYNKMCHFRCAFLSFAYCVWR